MDFATLASASFLSREDRKAYLCAAQIDEINAKLRLTVTDARRRDLQRMLADAKALARQDR